MKHDKFAAMKFENGGIMQINTDYITAYAYIPEKNQTVVACLGEASPQYFPGDQTHEIYVSVNSREG